MTRRSVGRPRKEINEREFKSLCGLQCTLQEIAYFYECDQRTIEHWCIRELGMKFNEAFAMYSAPGKVSLRRFQYELARSNATMAIWLGKQWLGQKDLQVVDQTVNFRNPFANLTEEELKKIANEP